MRNAHLDFWRLGSLLAACVALLVMVSCGPGPTETDLIQTAPAESSAAAVTATAHTEPPGLSPLPTTTSSTALLSPIPTGAEPTASPPPVPEPTEMETSSPSSTPEPVDPEVRTFSATPSEVANLGDPVSVTWAAVGERAELCRTNCFGPVDCEDVPLTGEKTLVSDEASLNTSGFALRVSAGSQTAIEAVAVRFLCSDLRTWFFDPPPPFCPTGSSFSSYAAGQAFEHGFMMWVEDTDEFFVFDSQPDPSGLQLYYTTVGLVLKPGASEANRTGEEPPEGMVEPVSGFGLIWRGEVEWPDVGDVRDRLGWATEPEFGFDTTTQYALLPCPRGWTAYMRGPHGEVLRLASASTIGWPLVWEVVQP